MEFLVIGLLIIGALPVLAYGGILIAGVMGLASTGSSVRTPLLMQIAEKSFLWGTLAYPLVYIPCAIVARNSSTPTSLFWSLIPLAYVVLMGLLFLLWGWLQDRRDKSLWENRKAT